MSEAAIHQPIVRLAPNVQLEPPVYLHEPVSIGPHSRLANCSLGAFSYLAGHCLLQNVAIGRYCQIAEYVSILNEHPVDWLTSHPFTLGNIFPPPYVGESFATFKRSDHTRVGNDVWIGEGARICVGVTIGDGAIIGAGAVVTKDVPPFAIVGGVPAKLIRMKFEPAIIERIQAVQWWQYNLIGKNIDWHEPLAALVQIERMAENGEIVPHNLPYFTVGQAHPN